MAAFFVFVLVVAAIINYILVVSNLKSCAENDGSGTWTRLLRLFLTIGVTLITFTYTCVAYYLWILPTFHRLLSVEGFCHALVFGYIWLNMVFNYFAVVLTSPGRAYSLAQLEEEGYNTETVNICKKCKRLKSLGTGHCFACGYCVRLLSHHSYFLNNCVGLNNFSYYYLFLCYASLGQGFGIYELYRPFAICVLHTGNGDKATGHCADLGDVAILISLLIIGLLSTFSTFVFHTVLLRVDKSQKELATEFKSSTSYCKYFVKFILSIFRRRLNRHRLQHMISERKPEWRDILLPALNEPPIDLAAEDYIDYTAEAEQMI